MTNSEKQTKPSAGASSAVPTYASAEYWGELLARRPTLVVGSVLLLMGWGFSLHVNNWHLTVPVFMLWMAWLGALVTVRLLWGVGLAVAGEASDTSMQALDVSEARRIELLEEKKSLIRAIKEIEFDRDLGKMSDEDATEMMRFYRARAVEVLKELAGNDDGALSVEERVERDLKARLAVEGAVQRGKAADSARAADKARPASAAEASKAKAAIEPAAKEVDDAPAKGVDASSVKEVDDAPAKQPDNPAADEVDTSSTTESKESSKKITTSASEESSEAPLESA